jgi:hypothetical protein
MKKILMLLVAASIIVGATGCSKPAEEAPATGTTTGTPEKTSE